MRLHYETVSPILRKTLLKISDSPIFKDFTLIGGTCLSLQLGHRRSIDIDLFTDMDYGSMDTKSIKVFLLDNFPYTEGLNSLDTSALGYSLRVGDSPTDKVKIDFFYTEKFIFPVVEIDHIKLADLREIAAMKMKAIAQDEPRQKDFWDIYELNKMYSFQDMVNWAIQRDEWGVSENDIQKGFQNIFNIEESNEGIDCYRGYEWDIISIDLKKIADEYFDKVSPSFHK